MGEEHVRERLHGRAHVVDAVRGVGDQGGDPPVGLTAKIQVRQAVDDVEPFATLYWFPSQTVPVVPVAAGSGLAPE